MERVPLFPWNWERPSGRWTHMGRLSSEKKPKSDLSIETQLIPALHKVIVGLILLLDDHIKPCKKGCGSLLRCSNVGYRGCGKKGRPRGGKKTSGKSRSNYCEGFKSTRLGIVWPNGFVILAEHCIDQPGQDEGEYQCTELFGRPADFDPPIGRERSACRSGPATARSWGNTIAHAGRVGPRDH